MFDTGPCSQDGSFMRIFILVANVLQAIGVAYVAQRAARKNREDKNGHAAKFE
jgi:hypothetical protein